jgi:hypothetical protein
MTDRDACDAPTARHSVSRRDFLGQAGRVAGGLLVLGTGGVGVLRPRAAAAAAQRSFTAGRFLLTLDHGSPVFVESFEGGTARAEVIAEAPIGNVGLSKKALGPHRFDPIRLRANLGTARPLLDRVQAMLAGINRRVSGTVVVADFDMKPQRLLDFRNALIAEVAFPALDVASKEAAFVEVSLQPEQAGWVDVKGEALAQDAKTPVEKVLLSSFRLTIDGVDCTGVNRIEALTIKQSAPAAGSVREFLSEPARVELPNLIIQVSEGKATGFQDWFKSFVIDGKSADDQEKTAQLAFLDPTRKETLLAIDFEHLGIFALARPPVSPTDAIARLTAEMYCEGMKLSNVKV